MAAELQGIIQTEVSRIQKVEWLSTYVHAHDKAFPISTSNILSAFFSTGINLFNLQNVFCRIPKIEVEIEDHQLLSIESEPKSPLPLDPSLIPSSPIDIATYQTARTALNEHMHKDLAFSMKNSLRRKLILYSKRDTNCCLNKLENKASK